MNATETIQKAAPQLNGIQKLCRTLKIMFWLYLGCLILALPSGFPFFYQTPDGWRVFDGTYRQVSDVPWGLIGLAAVAAGLLVSVAVTFYQLLSLYERGTIFSAGNVKLLRRLGWLAVGFGVFKITVSMMFVLSLEWSGLASDVFWRLILHNLVAVFFALLSSPWIMGGLFLLTISHVMLKGCQLQEEQELTV